MTDNLNNKAKLAASAKELIARKGWVRVTVPEIASEAGVGIVDALRIAPSKAVLVAACLDDVDKAVSTDPDRATAGADLRDSIFSAIMVYVDQLQAEREFYGTVVRGLRFDPVGSTIIGARFEQSLDAILDHAGLSADLVAGFARRRALSVLMLDVLRVWADDNSEDLSATMAGLNNRLTQIEGLIQSALGTAMVVAAKVHEVRTNVMGGGAEPDVHDVHDVSPAADED